MFGIHFFGLLFISLITITLFLGGIQLSELNFSNILASKSDIRHVKVKCHQESFDNFVTFNLQAMACSNSLLSSESNDVLFAVGYTNGKISLSSFDTSTQCLDLIGKEFSPKIPRQCNTLDFNRMDNHLVEFACKLRLILFC